MIFPAVDNRNIYSLPYDCETPLSTPIVLKSLFDKKKQIYILRAKPLTWLHRGTGLDWMFFLTLIRPGLALSDLAMTLTELGCYLLSQYR